ncbi:transposase family protein [Paenibacillus dendritiformis]|uniref:transposase family protein n=1 Tax=Paenibacillus dendritiformis TaxID=130049 RepID=UPI003B96CE83
MSPFRELSYYQSVFDAAHYKYVHAGMNGRYLFSKFSGGRWTHNIHILPYNDEFYMRNEFLLPPRMFNVALQLDEPWKLTHIEFDDQEQAWHLHLDFERGAVFACPRCSAECKAYDSEIKHWRHLDFWDWKTFMHARMPRVKCTSCNKVTQVYAKWARPLSHFTLMFEAWAMRLMRRNQSLPGVLPSH